MKELSGCLDSEGRLALLPSKRRRKLAALSYIADRIEPGREYTEREFSAFLNTLHTFGDPATLRREMFDYWLINRAPDGTGYCLNPDRPSLEELYAKYCG